MKFPQTAIIGNGILHTSFQHRRIRLVEIFCLCQRTNNRRLVQPCHPDSDFPVARFQINT